MPFFVVPGRRASAVLALTLGVGTTGCTSLLGDFSASSSEPDSSTESGISSDLGTTCTSNASCASGEACVDGVCCESACDGVCESCNQPDAAGHCSPIPAMTDPDKECVMIPIVPPEAGAQDDAGDAGASDAGATDGGDAATSDGAAAVVADASASDAEVSDAGAMTMAEAGNSFNLPDAGVVTSQGTCAGSCNGARACQYPGATTTCGTAFCNESSQVGGFACDGAGHCQPALHDCGTYSCESVADGGTSEIGACVQSCTGPADCSSSGYCDGAHCQPKLQNGAPCINDGYCVSNFCVTNGQSSVCCNTECNATDSTKSDYIPGATCSGQDSIGTCTCTTCKNYPGSSCVLWYYDQDGDGYGTDLASQTASPATAVIGCSTQPVPAHWSLTNDDCDDLDPNVHPHQTIPGTQPSIGTHTWDYNCDKKVDTQYPYFPNGSCSVCGGSSCTTGNACPTSGSASGAFSCFVSPYVDSCNGLRSIYTGLTLSSLPVSNPVVYQPVLVTNPCCDDVTRAFTYFESSITGQNGQCGVTGALIKCGSCNSSGVVDETVTYQAQGCL